VINALGWEVRGKFMQHDYTITRAGKPIATVHQKWLSWGDTYEIAVKEGVDAVPVLAIVLCFDVMHAESAAVNRAGVSGNN